MSGSRRSAQPIHAIRRAPGLAGAAAHAALTCLALAAASATAGEWRGNVGAELTHFIQPASDPQQSDSDLSLAADVEFFHAWDDDMQRVVVAPFLRVDREDRRRTHGDFRELYWQRSFEQLELAVGARRIFWGVTESRHLVDIVNQTDFVENIDGEDKLGQPMVSLRWLPDWGTLDLYLMPLFRERTYAGDAGRPRLPLPVLENDARYESAAGRRRLDVALRYSHYFGDWDIGLAHFSGTSRDPRLELAFDPAQGPVLIPFYDLLEQTSVDLQATKGSWLWKLEAVARHNADGRSAAVATGFEYTRTGLLGSSADLGIIVEYLFDDQPLIRGGTDNDVALGGRLTLNDVQGSELLLLAIVDAATGTRITSLEGSRRLGQSWRVSLEGRFFSNVDTTDFLSGLRDDDYLRLTLERYF